MELVSTLKLADSKYENSNADILWNVFQLKWKDNSSTYSKPYWTTHLTELSQKVQHAKTKWNHQSKPSNKSILAEATLIFYVRKLFERIIERGIRHNCELDDILNDEQDGFRCVRNTTRYLYKLKAFRREAQKKKFTAFLLCIDFEKAFVSIWLKELVVKLLQWKIQGNVLMLINSFLFNRTVQLMVNSNLGSIRKCNGYGVPQGPVLSPLIFIMFISGMLHIKNSPLNT